MVAQRTVPAAESLLNDVCVAGDHAYVTDSVADVLWRVPLGGDLGEPEPWIRFDDPAPQLYLNGIVALPDHATLLVAAQGAEDLRRIDIASRTVEILDLAIAVDGMVLVGDLLYTCDTIGTSHADVEMFVSQVRVSADARQVTLERRWPRARSTSPPRAAPRTSVPASCPGP